MTYKILVKQNGKPIMVKSMLNPFAVIEFIAECGKVGLEGVLV